jgi:hypothetical protein
MQLRHIEDFALDDKLIRFVNDNKLNEREAKYAYHYSQRLTERLKSVITGFKIEGFTSSLVKIENKELKSTLNHIMTIINNTLSKG